MSHKAINFIKRQRAMPFVRLDIEAERIDDAPNGFLYGNPSQLVVSSHLQFFAFTSRQIGHNHQVHTA